MSYYSVSGVVNSENNTYTDSDLNDTYATNYQISNDTQASAQAISNPSIVGGYVNSPGTGPSGTYYTSGDAVDLYTVSLTSGENVNLYSRNAGQYLDLTLYQSDCSTSVVASTNSSQVQTVTAPSAGSYCIAITPDSGGSYAARYTLAVGQPNVANVQVSASSVDFVPGDVLVRFKTSQVPAGIQISKQSLASMVGMQYKSGSPGQVMLLGLGDKTQRQQAARVLGFQLSSSGSGTNSSSSHDLKTDTEQAVAALRRRPDVLSADLNYIRHPMAVPTDTNYYAQWSLPMMNLPQAWDDTTRGSGVIVAVLDTGILPNHPDLAGQITSDGYDFISDPTEAGDGDGIDPDPTDAGDKVAPETRSSFHGTHVAGIIAADTCFTGDCPIGSAGIAGIAPHAQIMPLRVMGKGGGTDADIMQALLYAAGISPNASGTVPAQRADIINMSLGGGGYSSTFKGVIDQVFNAGVIIIAAAGNDGSNVPSYPAAYDHVISVSAVGPNKTLAPYSNYGSTIDVTAPGGDQSANYGDGVLSTIGDDTGITYPTAPIYTYDYYQGTSMAAPAVAGVAALMDAVYKNANGGNGMDETIFEGYLSSGAITDDIGPTGWDQDYGYGLIDAQKAVVAAGTTLNIGPTMVVDKSSIDFGGSSTSTTVTIKNSSMGTSKGSVSGVSLTPTTTSGGSWLSVSGLSSTTIGAYDSTDPEATFNINVDRSGLSDGYYSGTVTLAASNATSVVINVSLYVGSQVGDAGLQYVVLVDANTGSAVDSQIVNRNSNGQYSFSFTSVPDGNYFILSSSDMDNDYLLCEPGEACGLYPQTGYFTVNGSNITGLSMTTSYFGPSGFSARFFKEAAP